MSFFQSLRFKVFALIVLFFSMFLLLKFFYSYNKIQDESNRYLKSVNSSTASILSKQLVSDLYELNFTEVKFILSTFSNELIKNIIVLTEDGYIFSEKKSNKLIFKKFKNFEELEDVEKINKYLYKYPILLDTDIIGYLVIENSKELFEKELKKSISDLGFVFIAIFIIIVIISYLFSRIIVNPINKIIESISNKSDESIIEIDYKKNDELGYLARIIESNHNKILILNNDLKDKIENVTKMNNTIQKQQKTMIQQSKMVAIGEMIGNIAHQWRQPLSAISTISTGMELEKEMGVLSKESISRHSKKINENVQFLSRTLDVFQGFMKTKKRKEHINLKKIVKDSINIMKGVVSEYNIKVIYDIDDEIYIDGDSNELTQCIVNIFNNSKDAYILGKEKLFFISAKQADKKVIIEFKDNAGGISEDILPKVFEPYTTTKHQSQGTGLGLYITYTLIVDSMGGELTVRNSVYEFEESTYIGAVFKISIPC